MRIAIDVEAAYRSATGTGVYVKEMVTHLAEVADSGEYTLVTSSRYAKSKALELEGKSRFHRGFIPVPRKICQGLWVMLDWPPVNRYIGEHDIYHNMRVGPFPARGGKQLVTVHDLAWVTLPEVYKWRHRYVWSVSLKRMLKRVDHYVAISEWTKHEMMEYLKIPSERITVISEGVKSCFRRMDQGTVDGVLKKHGLNEPYFLVVGNMNPRKNHMRVVRAFAGLLARDPGPVTLLFCGPTGYRAEQTMEEVRRLKIAEHVKLLGYQPEDDVVALMNGARGLMFVSLCEGFGLPIVEAMACGTPVVTSTVTSMPEVAGDAALLVDPTSEEEITEAMWKLMKSEGLREELVAKGLKRVTRFSWNESARQLFKLYQRLAG